MIVTYHGAEDSVIVHNSELAVCALFSQLVYCCQLLCIIACQNVQTVSYLHQENDI